MLAIVVMLVGIGFLAVLTGAVAERFLTTRVEEAAEETREEVAGDIDAAEAGLVEELREIRARLERLEVRLGRH